MYPTINGKIQRLPKADCKPFIFIPRQSSNPRKNYFDQQPSLVVIRNGNTKLLRISKSVARELIAMGLGFGD
jgi:hypothetical protein